MRGKSTDELCTVLGHDRPASVSARAGFLPIPLRRTPSAALRNIAIYLRANSEESADSTGEFVQYRSPAVRFTVADRARLIHGGCQFIYIPIDDQALFQCQVERALAETAKDPQREFAERSAMVYETSVEVMNEVLADGDWARHAPRVRKMSRAVTTLVLNNANAFRHLFAASHHDFYTATHMVNVGTWMVPVAHALGCRQSSQLAQICQAGLLHDLGKTDIPTDLLNKPAPLSTADRLSIRRHPELGSVRLRASDEIAPLAQIVARQHHERMDGSGYPAGLRGDEIHRVSRICAVVDSFDAMTALRPYKHRAMCVSDAIIAMKKDTPAKYDPDVVDAWLGLLNQVDDKELLGPSSAEPAVQPEGPGHERRGNKRFACQCPARLHVLLRDGRGWREGPGLEATLHSASRFGVGLFSSKALALGERLHIYIRKASASERVLRGECVRCRAHEGGWFEIGVELYRRR